MASSTSTTPRERGTLRRTLFRRPSVILSIVLVVSAAVAAFVCDYATNNDGASAAVVVGAGLGSLSALLGIVFCDPSVHAFGFGFATLVSLILHNLTSQDGASVMAAITAALPSAVTPILAAVLCSVPALSGLLTMIPASLFCNGFVIITLCTTAFLSIVLGSIHDGAEPAFAPTPPTLVALFSLCLLDAYHRNRSHPNGRLTIAPQSDACSLLVFLAIVQSVNVSSSDDSNIIFLAILLGSGVAVLMAASFGSVADVWYAVGSGQFHMVSVDTAGIMFYVASPLAFLSLRFVDRYGSAVGGAWTSAARFCLGGIDVDALGLGDPSALAESGTLAFLTLVAAVGVPLINALCPIGGYLNGHAYTHGQPNTKKAAICVDFSDLFDERAAIISDATDGASLWKILRDHESGCKINVFITLQDITACPEVVQKLAKNGHLIGVSSTQGSIDVLASCEELADALGDQPRWYHVGRTDGPGRRPLTLQLITELGMKTVFWSTHLQVTDEDGLSEEDKENIRNDIGTKNGGSLIYITGGDSRQEVSSSRAVAAAIRQILEDDALGDISFAPLSSVIKDDATMEL